MRCLTLAQELRTFGAECVFFVSDETVETVPALGDSGFRAQPVGMTAQDFSLALGSLPVKPDLIVLDSYDIDRDYELSLSGRSTRLLVIDDLANRVHCCDMLVDQTPGRQASAYDELVSGDCRILTGAKFALLRPSFLKAAPASRARHARLQGAERLLLSMGLTDVGGVTANILRALRTTTFKHIDVVLPRSAPSWSYTEQSAAEDPRIRVHAADADMADLMLHADIAVGGSGTTSLERCCLGLPTVMLRLADNQAAIAAELSRRGAALLADDAEHAARMAHNLADDASRLRQMSVTAAKLVDGLGANRVGRAVRELCGCRAETMERIHENQHPLH